MRTTLALLACLLAAGPASATLIAVDYLAPGDGLITRDTETGLDWLDFTVTAGLSFAEVQAGPLYAAGWRHATTSDALALAIFSFGLGDMSGFEAQDPYWRGLIVREQSQDAVALMALLGATADAGDPFYATLGNLADPYGRGPKHTLHVAYDGAGGSMLAIHYYWLVPSPNIGNALVRETPVPEPTAVLMLALGLLPLVRRAHAASP